MYFQKKGVEHIPTKNELRILQALPLELKIAKTKLRIREWINMYGVDGVYISFSGGKDSTALLDLIRQEYPNVKAVYIDTGLEYPEIKVFVKQFDNIEIVKPEMPFTQVIQKYGYPIISKETSKNIYYGRKAKERGDKHMYDYYINGHRHNKNTGEDYIFMPLAQKWLPLLESDIPISNRCCQIMKKNPAKQYEQKTGQHPFIGEMAEDSKERETQYLHTSCNAFNSKRPISKPIGFWTEQDVLAYLVLNKVIYAHKVYGAIQCKYNGTIISRNNVRRLYEKNQDVLNKIKFSTTGVNRTGCVFCGFGVHLQSEPNKFQQMKNTHPQLWDYCIHKLGMGEIFDYINVKY